MFISLSIDYLVLLENPQLLLFHLALRRDKVHVSGTDDMSRTHQAAKQFVRLKTLKCSILKRSPSRYSYTYRLFKFLYCQVN